MRSLCQIVLLASLAAAVLPGCYLFHGVEGEPTPTPGVDAGSPPPGARDASTPMPGRDAGGPLLCPNVRANATCLESFLVAPGRAFSLPYTFDTCGCCVETECAVTVDRATQTLSLTTTLCPDPCDCSACVTPTGACEVPALERGAWRVVVNGAPAFELPVFEDSGLVAPPPACATYAEVDECGAPVSEPLPGAPWTPGSRCAEPRIGSGALDVIDVHHHCWGCGDLQGPCVATLEESLTDEPGGDLHIQPTRYPGACDVDCPDICIRATRSCVVPELQRGGYYRVFVGEERVMEFVAGEIGRFCGDIAG
ncbi:MAG: hypothetical protein M3Y87_30810 [Myxococcota bacterium]|nr:hypothetical protein [Myxococcota bacterium]